MRFYFFIWQKSLVEKHDFVVIEELNMMSGEGFYLFIQVFSMS